MARPNNINILPSEVKAWLDKTLLEGNFTGYQALAEYLQQQGYGISKSGLHRYGSKLERRLATIKATVDASKIIAQEVDDPENDLNGALASLTQAGMFNVLVNIEEASAETDPSEQLKLYTSAAKGVAELGRMSIANKKWQAEVRAKAEAAANKVETLGKKGGLSAETAEAIRREILGIAA
jgi:hypothetical protein